jgi:MIP family channel proteins
MTQDSWRRYVAEAIGTFFIVFGACGAVISDAASKGAVGLAGISFVPGLMVLAMITALGPISGAHFNPAVTLAFALVRRFSWAQVVPYIAAQAIGALAASAAHSVLFGQAAASAANYGAHIPNVPTAAAFGFEFVFGFLLMFVIMAVATDPRVQAPVPALAIGLTVALAIYMGGPISGASMNPIRSLAPALFNGGAALTALPIYIAAPVLGAAAAAVLFEWLGAKAR